MNIYGRDFERDVQTILGTLSKKNRELLAAYIETKKVKPQRKVKIATNIRTFATRARISDLSRADANKVQAFFQQLIQQNKSSETQLDYKVVLGGFFRWMHKIDDNRLPPELISLKGTKFKAVRKQGPVLIEDDIAQMIDAALTVQQKAFISVLWFSGGRIGEVLMLRKKGIELVNPSAQEFRLFLDGKTGPREVLIIDKWGFIGQHLGKFRGEADALLFTTRKGKPSYAWFKKMLSGTSARAGIAKPTNPHWFRHSAATALATSGMPGPLMNPYMGWTPGSGMASHYLHTTGRAADAFIRSLAGKNADEFVRQNLGGLDNTASREREKLFAEFGEYFLKKYGPIIVQKTVEGLKELESHPEPHLTFSQDATAEHTRQKLNAVVKKRKRKPGKFRD